MEELRKEIDHVIKVFFQLLGFMDDENTGKMEMEKFLPELFKRLAESASKYLTYQHPKLKEVFPEGKLFDCINKKLRRQEIETENRDTFEKIARTYRPSGGLSCKLGELDIA